VRDRRLVPEASGDAYEQGAVERRGRFRETIVNPETFLSSGHKAVLPEVSQVPRDRGLGQAQRLVHVVDAQLPALGEEATPDIGVPL
jgi:hypothetical protein